MERSAKSVLKVAMMLMAVIVISCQSPTKEEVASEQQLLDSLEINNTALAANPEANEVIALSAEQVSLAKKLLAHYEDSKAIDKWIFEGGKAGRTSARYEEAITLFKAYVERNPNGEKVAEAVFLTGFIYDEDLKDKARAKTCYERIVQDFPNHDLADDAKALMEQLYMTDEEIIKMLQEKAQEQQPAS